ncbi:MAG: tetraacyldisaccharide 4'-kinase [Chlorobi bacterium]|nr:tetraacyldisaccharide 4'-kinase [Chlorobiota bacterium]
MNLLRIILFPFSLLYGLVILLRNRFFDWGILPSKSYPFPVISVGNLSVGGTGKSPHVEYLVRLLQNDFKLATLSRGYKRKTSGFLLAGDNPKVEDFGDEPCQFARKFPEVKVAVDEKRARGINILSNKFPDLDVVVLDDAFQHRHVKPGLSVLLTDYHRLYSNDYPLPTGKLREFGSGAKRADIIVVTKTSNVLSPITQRNVKESLKIQPYQKIYFSHIKHGKLKPLPGLDISPSGSRFAMILMFAGIANTYPLEDHLKKFCGQLETLIFPDHHQYVLKDVEKIVNIFDNLLSKNKIIVTTEKDAMRLIRPEFIKILKHFPVFYVPIEIEFHKEGRKEFNKQILDYVKENRRNNEIRK